MTDINTSRGTLALAAALADGSTEALSECYRLWSPLVLGIATRALGNRVDAEDVVQQVFVSAWKSRETLRPSESALPAWLIGIARRRIADEYARRSREAAKAGRAASVLSREGAHGADGVGPDSLDHVDTVVDRVVLRQAVDALPEPRRSVLNLAYVEDRTQEDIAARLDMPIGTVKSHVRRGLLHLRRELREVTDDPRD